MGYVYCLHDFTNEMCRIGKTKSHSTGRMKTQAGYYPFELTPISINFGNEDLAEKHFHQVFKDKNIRADWFKITPDDFDDEVRKYKSLLGEPVPPKAIGIIYNGSIKFWRVLSEKGEHKCDFIHIHYDNLVLKLKCKGVLFTLKFSDDEDIKKAKYGDWVKALASGKNNFKFVKVRFK